MSEIETMLESVENVLKTTSEFIEAMPAGDRVTLQDLTEHVRSKLSLDVDNTLPFVHYFVHNSKLVTNRRGPKGGIIKK